jgi:hypothetical protein
MTDEILALIRRDLLVLLVIHLRIAGYVYGGTVYNLGTAFRRRKRVTATTYD